MLARVSLLVVQGRLGIAKYERLQHDVRCVGREMNALQSSFEYEFYAHDPLKGDEGAKAGHSLAEYYRALKTFRAANPSDNHCIAISNGRLEEEAWFNHQRGGLGVISVLDFDRYAPPGTSRQQYLMYLILCVSLLVRCKGFEEHKIPEACLFDGCDDPLELKAGLRRPQIHSDCRSKLTQDHMISADQFAGFDRVLKRVRRRDLYAMVSSRTSATDRSFLFGIGAAFVANVITHESVRAGLAIGWAIILTVFFWWFAGRTRDWKVVERYPSWSRRFTAALFVALLAVGLALCLWAGKTNEPTKRPDESRTAGRMDEPLRRMGSPDDDGVRV